MMIIFTTVLVDLLGFGIVIPLISLYGRHFGANSFELAILGCAYSLMQFFFAPFWGSLSDRFGRRPILLVSLAGSTLSYVGFALSHSYIVLLATRIFAGIFAANISAAQAYIADITTKEERARGMGMLGAAFGIGFMLGPPIGGIGAKYYGLSAPGWFAATICGLNFLAAFFRLKESLPQEKRAKNRTRSLLPLDPKSLSRIFSHTSLWRLILIFFGVTFAFSTMEQTLSLLIQKRLGLETQDAAHHMGMVLMASSFIGAIIQGGLIRRLVQKHGEAKLLFAGLCLNALGYILLPRAEAYSMFFYLLLPLTVGSSLVNPSLSALISKSADASEQGMVLGINQGMGSLARAIGPFVGLLTFSIATDLPYMIGLIVTLILVGIFLTSDYGNKKRPSMDQGEGG